MNSWHDQSTFLPLLWPIPLGPPCECVAACTVVLVGSESSWSCQTCLRSCQLYKPVSKYCRAPPESNLIECLKQGLTSHKLCWWVKLSNGMAPWWKSARLLIGPRWVWSFSSCWISTKAVFLLQAASSHEQPLSLVEVWGATFRNAGAHTQTHALYSSQWQHHLENNYSTYRIKFQQETWVCGKWNQEMKLTHSVPLSSWGRKVESGARWVNQNHPKRQPLNARFGGAKWAQMYIGSVTGWGRFGILMKWLLVEPPILPKWIRWDRVMFIICKNAKKNIYYIIWNMYI